MNKKKRILRRKHKIVAEKSVLLKARFHLVTRFRLIKVEKIFKKKLELFLFKKKPTTTIWKLKNLNRLKNKKTPKTYKKKADQMKRVIFLGKYYVFSKTRN